MGLSNDLTKKTPIFHLPVWALVVIFVVVPVVLLVLPMCISRRRSKKATEKLPISQNQIVSSEFKEIRMDQNSAKNFVAYGGEFSTSEDKYNGKDSDKLLEHLRDDQIKNPNINSRSGSFNKLEDTTFQNVSSPLSGLPEFSHLGWGHWFTLRDLEVATNRFSKDNVIGEGGYGVVYQGYLPNGSIIAVKKIFNNLGQAEKDFKIEVEAIGHVRHKNLVRLLGYCIEGTQRMLVYEYVNNGNLEQWLHGAMSQHGCLTWAARMKVILGTAKALAYLHEAIEPKVVHRDIKSSNILLDDEFNAKISDFGLAKLLGAGESHITTRVMGTFGYVAPEYANSGLLNEKSDVYSFGVVLLEAITGRDPVDYGRPADEVNMVDWLKLMVGSKRSEEVIDPSLEPKPSRTALKRALLTALRCVDPDSQKRLTMSEVVRMLESEDYPLSREGRRRQRNQGGATEAESAGSKVTEIHKL
ncbi:hypothetical protein DCAR_0935348 [Daucus carota subsp. sativus]|uniref:non-specific serine/threonine protein kinase n=1 Tax=Daucus carota subsp. sativus TaxID=79200 RepID=A0A175YH36_DAUCS|nr:PREDICTED: probable receptor-like protein kinase At5g18500 isoform X1 [Daucus carota subsp. sativus]XP_017226528.1 PREDICTED: probable receptor-like protein kinase At5g18500 isoform X1 [Daucus carota subsp. sativus]WOH15802.1 hypothetical protein DCAR_0935348 [Daucus carota subsp. sativus]